MGIFFPIFNFFSFKSIEYTSPLALLSFKINENLTCLTFPKKIKHLNHYDCCWAKVLEDILRWDVDVANVPNFEYL
jgi:hypothetical protein